MLFPVACRWSKCGQNGTVITHVEFGRIQTSAVELNTQPCFEKYANQNSLDPSYNFYKKATNSFQKKEYILDTCAYSLMF